MAKVFMISPEVVPFVKIGGLADVAGSLPKVLEKQGHDVRLVCPLYGCIERQSDWIPYYEPLGAELGGEELFCRIWQATLPGSEVIVYFLEHDGFYHRQEVYAGPWGDHGDNGERFAFFSRAGLNLCYYLGWIPDVIHCHDWTTGLVPVYLNTVDRNGPLGKTASVITIHNLEHQGHFPQGIVQYAHLSEDLIRSDALESMGSINFLKGGIYNATKITTVSPSYAKEIQTKESGCGLDEVLRFRAGDLIGILNGIDKDEWDPETDKLIPANFSTKKMKGKDKCKVALQKAFGLKKDFEMPVFGVVSRLYEQKGLDLLEAGISQILKEMRVQIALIGEGDSYLEERFRARAAEFPGQLGVYIGFDNELAHLVIAGSDFFIMPSRFEPCGLGQIYASNYGTLPVVRATGGLGDTVEQYVEGEGRGTGFLFEDATSDALCSTIRWACSTYYDRPEEFQQMRTNGMKKDFSWTNSAKQYSDVYEWAIKDRRGCK